MRKILLLVLCCCVMFSACTGKDTPTDGVEVNHLESGDLIVNHNENMLRMAVLQFDTLNPFRTESQTVLDCIPMVYEPLFDMDEQWNPVGILAENYAVSDSALEATVQLKNNVKWQDGSDFSAYDVVYTFDQIKNMDCTIRSDLTEVSEMHALDAHTVQVTFSRAVPNKAALLTFPIVKNGTDLSVTEGFVPVGTGAYRYAEEQKTNQVALVANENWHGGMAAAKTVVLHVLRDRNAAVYAFEANEVDVLTSGVIDLNSSTPRGDFYQYDYVSNMLTFLGFNNERSRLSDASVRKALSYAIQKQELIDNELYSRAVLADVPINPTAWFAPAADETVTDATDIQQLMAEAGWEKREDGHFYREIDGGTQEFILEFVIHEDNAEKVRIAQRIIEHLSREGFLIRTRKMGYSEYREAVYNGEYDLFLGEVLLGKNLDPQILTGAGNYFGCENPELSDAAWRMGMAKDNEQLKTAYADYARIFRYNMPYAPLFFRTGSVLYAKQISGNKTPTPWNVYRNVDGWYFSKTDINK